MYTISGMPAGNYDVEFYTYPCGGKNYVTQWYNNMATGAASQSTSSVVSTTVNSPTYGINAGLALAAEVTGTVTANSGLTNVSGVCVTVTSTDGGIGASTTTAANGTYTVFGLAADSYQVLADPSCGGTVTTAYATLCPVQ